MKRLLVLSGRQWIGATGPPHIVNLEGDADDGGSGPGNVAVKTAVAYARHLQPGFEFEVRVHNLPPGTCMNSLFVNSKSNTVII